MSWPEHTKWTWQNKHGNNTFLLRNYLFSIHPWRYIFFDNICLVVIFKCSLYILLCMHCSQDLLWSCSVLHVNRVCSGDKPINHFILMGPCYHLGDYYILLTLRDTISYPWLFTLPTPIRHIALLLCSCKSDEGHASFCRQRWENQRLAFIHNSEVGGRQGSLVRKEMSCYPVMTMLVREHLWQHQRASNYNQFPLQNASKTLHSSNKRGCQWSGLPLRWQPCVDRPGESVPLYHPQQQLVGHCVSMQAAPRN